MAEKNTLTYPWFMERKYLPLITVLAFVILSVVAFSLCYRHHTIHTEQTLKGDRSTANLLSLVLDERLKKIISVMEAYSNRPLLLQAARNKNAEKATVHLISLTKNNPDIDSVIITDRQGTLWAIYPKRPEVLGKNFAYRDWYKDVSKEWKPGISSVYLRVVAEKDLAVSICIPIFNETGGVIGILQNTHRTVSLSNIIKQMPLDSGTFITVTDRKGQIIYSSEHDVKTEIKPYPFHAGIKKAMAANNKTFAVDDPDLGGRTRYISYAPVTNIGWTVSVERDKRSILLSESAYYIQVTAIALLLFLTIILSLIYSRKQVMTQQIMAQLEAEEAIRKLNAELEQRVIDRTAQLSASNKELEYFSYSVSHDLRAPLRSIDGFSLALLEEYRDKPLDDTGKNYLERVRKATQKMDLLIDDLLKLLKVTQSEFQHESIDLSNMVRDLAETFRKSNPDRAVDVTVQEGIMVQGDPYLLTIAMENLVGNAFKFTGKEAHPRIEFGAVNKDGETCYFIRDNGVGFDMAYVDKLFGAFQRLHASDEFPGTGIGLAMVQRIIHRHRGRIWAEGEVGKGATFYITLV